MMVENYHADYPGNTSVYFSNYTNEAGKVTNFVVQQWGDSSEPVFFLKANEAINKPGTTNWTLKNVYVKHISFPKGKVQYYAQLDTTLSFSIDEMAQRENVAETMTYPELSQLIEREKIKGSSRVPYYEIEMHQRTSYPFATYILTIIGVSVASRKKRGGIGLNIAIGLGFVFVYIFAMKVMAVAALNVGLPALIAVWTPNLLFGIIAFFLYRTAQK
jgi:lipopolysaccharide export system permease protein